MQTHTETITRLRAALASLEPAQAEQLMRWSRAAEIYRPDCDVEWAEHRALGGLVSALVSYASHFIDKLPEVEAETLPAAVLSDSVVQRLTIRLAQQQHRDRDQDVLARVWWVFFRLDYPRAAMKEHALYNEEMTRAQAHELLRATIGDAGVELFESEAADTREDKHIEANVRRAGYWSMSPKLETGAVVWSLDRIDAALAWLAVRLTEIDPVPELIDLADRAGQHAYAYQCARLEFRRTFGRQPRKAERESLGPWMKFVERYRQRAEQLCAGRSELLRWYIDHVGVVVDAPAWSHHSIESSRSRGLALLRRAEAANTPHPARAVVS